MARTLPTTVVQAMNAATTDILLLALVEISHSLITTYRIVNNTENVTHQGNTFLAYPFAVVLPEDAESNIPTIEIRMMNAAVEMVDEVRTVAGQRELAQATLKIVEYSDPETVLLEYTDYDVLHASVDRDLITLSIGVETFLNDPFPAARYSPANFPGMF